MELQHLDSTSLVSHLGVRQSELLLPNRATHVETISRRAALNPTFDVSHPFQLKQSRFPSITIATSLRSATNTTIRFRYSDWRELGTCTAYSSMSQKRGLGFSCQTYIQKLFGQATRHMV